MESYVDNYSDARFSHFVDETLGGDWAFGETVNSKFEDAKTYTDNKVASLVDSAPGTLDTLNELAQALGDDPNFATTITNQLSEVRELVNNDEDFYTQPTAPAEAVDGDFWIDTSADTYAQKKIYESPTEPLNSQDGDLWIDTSDMV
jgi:hypothetical protein